MMRSFKEVDLDDPTSAVPAFLALISMVLTYSISNGIGIGAISYVFIRICTGKFSKKDLITLAIAVIFILKFVSVTV